jgi:hypothetical protein
MLPPIPDSSVDSWGAAADCGGNTVWTASAAAAVFRIDTATGAVTQIPTPWNHYPMNVACVAQTNRVYATATDGLYPTATDYLEVIDTMQNQWLYEVTLGTEDQTGGYHFPTGIAVSPCAPGSQIYVGNQSGTMYFVDAGTLAVASIGLGTGSVNGVAVHASGQWVYAVFAPTATNTTGSLKRITVSSHAAASTNIPKPSATPSYQTRPFGIALDHSKTGTFTAYVTDPANNNVRVCSGTSATSYSCPSTAIDHLYAGFTNPQGIAVTADDTEIVVCGSNEVDELLINGDPKNHYPVGSPGICLGNFITPFVAQ